MNCQMIRVISSPSSSTTVPSTLIFAMPAGSLAPLLLRPSLLTGSDNAGWSGRDHAGPTVNEPRVIVHASSTTASPNPV